MYLSFLSDHSIVDIVDKSYNTHMRTTFNIFMMTAVTMQCTEIHFV